MSYSLDKIVESELRSLPGNNVCCDCDGKIPQWASVSLGIFMCLECSGRHRSLGVHISFVRSVSMDSWSDKQIEMMRKGGNEKCISFLLQYGIQKNTPIQQKYNSPAAMLYKDRLSAVIEGRPLPTELPKSLNTTTSHLAQGSDPVPGESESEYVARQRKLQEEARERMRAKFGGSAGLNSSGAGGKMAAMGSDPGYRPGGGGGQGLNINTAEVTAQLADVSQKAFSFLSSTVQVLGEKVSQVSVNQNNGNSSKKEFGGGYADDNSNSNSAKHSNSNSNSNNNNNNNSSNGNNGDSGWGALLTSSAANLWSKTSDIVKDLTKPLSEEELLGKFPRGNGSSSAPQNNGNGSDTVIRDKNGLPIGNTAQSSNEPYSNNNNNNNNNKNNDSQKMRENSDKKIEQKKIVDDDWDEEDLDTEIENEKKSSNSLNQSNFRTTPTTAPKISSEKQYQLATPTLPSSTSFNSTGSNNSISSMQKSQNSLPSTPVKTATSTTPITVGKSDNKNSSPLPPPVDFFATFGV